MNDQSKKKDYDGPLYAPWHKVEKFRKERPSYVDHLLGDDEYPPAFKRDSNLSE